MGAGRTEVMDTVFGLRKAEKGTVTMKGNQMGTVKKQFQIEWHTLQKTGKSQD